MKLYRRVFWVLWFTMLLFAPYTPLVSPQGRATQEEGIPMQLLLWFAFTGILIISIWIFAWTEWKVTENDD